MNDGLASTKWGSWYPFTRARVSTRSPPTRSASEARSCRVVTTLSLAKAGDSGSPRRARARPATASFVGFIMNSLERVGAMGADRELDLKKQLIGGLSIRVLAASKLATDLGELARPERQKKSLPSVSLRGIVGMLRRLDARPREPALRELVLAGEEPAREALVHGSAHRVEIGRAHV